MTALPDNGRKQIMLVEDDESLRTMMVKALEVRYNVVSAADGQIATELLSSGVRPDLFIFDVMMPHVDGLTLARRVKENPTLSRTPIILVSAKIGPQAVIMGIQAGAKHYIEKPFRIADLMSRIDQLLK